NRGIRFCARLSRGAPCIDARADCRAQGRTDPSAGCRQDRQDTSDRQYRRIIFPSFQDARAPRNDRTKFQTAKLRRPYSLTARARPYSLPALRPTPKGWSAERRHINSIAPFGANASGETRCAARRSITAFSLRRRAALSPEPLQAPHVSELLAGVR